MNKRLSATIIIMVFAALLFNIGLGQEASYLTQKLMLENDLRQRIKEALSKIIDESKYVVDVSVDLELSDEIEEQVTVFPGGQSGQAGRQPTLEGSARQLSREADQQSADRTQRETMVGLPIPGFEFEIEGEQDQPEVSEPETDAFTGSPSIVTNDADDNVISKTSSFKRPSKARVRKMEISVILQEGAAPELIENIRQIVMVASRYNRARGDVLSIMTASFKKRRDEKTAEQILLKTIAEKIDAIEKKREQKDARAEVGWQDELKQYKAEEEKRREEDRVFFQAELSKLEMSAKERAFQQEKQEILRRDSLKLLDLNQEIQSLRNLLSAPALTDSQAMATETAVQKKEREKAELDAQITEKIAMLESVQSDLNQLQDDMNGTPTMVVVLLSLLGALLLILVVVLIIILVNNRFKQQSFGPPLPWMYPPRRVAKKKSKPSVSAPPTTERAVAPAPAPPSPQPAVEEDPGVLQSEINDIRKSVVSMSVGQPQTATRIIKEWMQEEAPPPPPEPAAVPEPEEEEDSGKKKKKKK